MPRIPLVNEPDMTPAQRRVFDAMISGQRTSAPVGPLAIALHELIGARRYSVQPIRHATGAR